MLTFLRSILMWLLVNGLYVGGIATGIISLLFRAEWGLYMLVALIPLPTLWYKLYEYPYGKDLLDYLFVTVLIGVFVNKKSRLISKNSILLIIFILVSYFSLWNSSARFSLPIPVTTDNPLLKIWKAYFFMILLYFLITTAIETEKQQMIVAAVMIAVVLLLSIKSSRDFVAGSSFSDDRRDPGPFWIVRLGSNHFGSFISYSCSFILGLFFLDKDKKRRILYIATVVLGLHPLFFSYSRGAYAAFFCALLFFALIRQRALLIGLVLILFLWETVLPVTVTERIRMTQTETGLESSASARLDLWNAAIGMFNESPLLGNGFYSFAIAKQGGRWSDTHNFYLKILCEQGAIGLVLLATVLLAAFWSGWKLYRTGGSEFQRGLGFGFMGCVISQVVANVFGDRWSYYEMASYFWVIWGLVDRGLYNSKKNARLSKENSGSDAAFA